MQQLQQSYSAKHPIADLKPHPQNPRRGDESVIVESIEANGFYGAIIVQKSTGFVLVGNHRLKIARQQGATTVPALVLDIDDAAAKRIMLVDNRSSDKAGYDAPALIALLSGENVDLAGTGYSDTDLLELLATEDAPPVEEEARPAPAEPQMVISYQIIFDTMAQQNAWFDYLRELRERFPEAETIAERLTLATARG